MFYSWFNCPLMISLNLSGSEWHTRLNGLRLNYYLSLYSSESTHGFRCEMTSRHRLALLPFRPMELHHCKMRSLSFFICLNLRLDRDVRYDFQALTGTLAFSANGIPALQHKGHFLSLYSFIWIYAWIQMWNDFQTLTGTLAFSANVIPALHHKGHFLSLYSSESTPGSRCEMTSRHWLALLHFQPMEFQHCNIKLLSSLIHRNRPLDRDVKWLPDTDCRLGIFGPMKFQHCIMRSDSFFISLNRPLHGSRYKMTSRHWLALGRFRPMEFQHCIMSGQSLSLFIGIDPWIQMWNDFQTLTGAWAFSANGIPALQHKGHSRSLSLYSSESTPGSRCEMTSRHWLALGRFRPTEFQHCNIKVTRDLSLFIHLNLRLDPDVKWLPDTDSHLGVFGQRNSSTAT